jgi:hypothetical protein
MSVVSLDCVSAEIRSILEARVNFEQTTAYWGQADVTGLEELLGYIADWIGLDLVGRSRTRIIASVLSYSILGLVLSIGGLYSLISYHNGGVVVLSGVFCSILGLAFLIRIGINLAALFRQRRQSSAPIGKR